MNDYRFRTTFTGLLVLQRRVEYYNVGTRSRDWAWRDAAAQDLAHYYKQLYDTHTTNTTPATAN